jgi:hypothetical protein
MRTLYTSHINNLYNNWTFGRLHTTALRKIRQTMHVPQVAPVIVQMDPSHSELTAQVASLPPPPQLLLFRDYHTRRLLTADRADRTLYASAWCAKPRFWWVQYQLDLDSPPIVLPSSGPLENCSSRRGYDGAFWCQRLLQLWWASALRSWHV